MNYIIMCLNDDDLNPSCYIFASGMFNDFLYKSSEAELKLITDIDEYLIVEKSISRDMTIASYCYAKANNPKYVMTQYMPIKILRKVSPEQVLNIQTSEKQIVPKE
ncbi:2822_t:CDS:2 [Funneliformis mosseae]|uniref:2822_t:CDS:1 n=1 Tax=Funneliformis mosseae TaxID=27381 RepID=A0A9N9CB71_FUNMO|nr:2822_t:CDS:2 [Funneliformis mosseae]